MRIIYRLAIVAVSVVTLFLVYSPLGVFYIFGGFICAAISYYPRSETHDGERKEPLFPSSTIGNRASAGSAAWLGAKVDEEEELRRKAQNQPR